MWLRGARGGELPGFRSDSRDGGARLLRPARSAQEKAGGRLQKMFEEFGGLGEEEEEVVVTGAASTQTEGPHLAGRDPEGQSPGAGCLRSCRTLCHPSFQPFYSAVSGCSCGSRPPPPEGPAWEAGPPPFLDCSSFFYTDPTQPPGSRIYNWLSCCSLEVLPRLRLDTPAPIMAPRESPPAPGLCTRRRWFSSEELQAVAALLELPAAPVGPQADSGAERRDP
ncbi:histone deacetylase complex subunit SAP25 [Crotalus tigris]|uniref:histone deacetylase complex subunit SAP25 n=1 Tax=Crotalus tigris TaxID=88082 RepID=UPI00192F694F|nr:histone deacetylase complex subunit SAP25 [Crotalus tigris]